MCTCPTKSSPRGANAVGMEHLRTWHVLASYLKCVAVILKLTLVVVC